MNHLALRTRVWRPALCVAAAVSLAGAAVGCGSDDQKIARAKAEGKQEAIDQQKADAAAAEVAKLRRQTTKLRKQVGGLRKNKPSGGGGGSVNNAAPPPSSGSASCGDGVSVNSVTTCPFGRNVRDAYQSSGGGSIVEVYSPVTKRTYTMRCSDGVPTVCTGGNGAAVYIR
jgi:hypothetical protein